MEDCFSQERLRDRTRRKRQRHPSVGDGGVETKGGATELKRARQKQTCLPLKLQPGILERGGGRKKRTKIKEVVKPRGRRDLRREWKEGKVPFYEDVGLRGRPNSNSEEKRFRSLGGHWEIPQRVRDAGNDTERCRRGDTNLQSELANKKRKSFAGGAKA